MQTRTGPRDTHRGSADMQAGRPGEQGRARGLPDSVQHSPGDTGTGPPQRLSPRGLAPPTSRPGGKKREQRAGRAGLGRSLAPSLPRAVGTSHWAEQAAAGLGRRVALEWEAGR